MGTHIEDRKNETVSISLSHGSDGNKQGSCGKQKRPGTKDRRKDHKQRKDDVCRVSNTNVQIRIPLHSSVLSHPCFVPNKRCLITDSSFPSDTTAVDAINDKPPCKTDHKHTDETPLLNLHVNCYHPGVLWRGLFPMLKDVRSMNFHMNEARNREQGTSIETDSDDSDAAKPTPKPIVCGGEAKIDTTPASNNASNATSSSIPQHTVLALGLKSAVERELSAIAVGRTRGALPTRKDDSYGTTCMGYLQQDQQQESDSDVGHDHDPSELFYELTLAIDLAPLNLNRIAGRTDGNHEAAKSHLCATESARFTIYLYLYPPLTSRSDIDRTPFSTIVSVSHRKVLVQKACSAWCSTLGGGYFGIKDLGHSLWLSRYQRTLAMHVGDLQTARQCTINEAYNWMYAGRFRQASVMLKNLEQEVETTRSATSTTVASTKSENAISDRQTSRNCSNEQTHLRGYYTVGDEKILQHCRTAKQFLRRLKRLSREGLAKYQRLNPLSPSLIIAAADNTVSVSRTADDFQRFRIVSC
mmetsp:Transcript_14576/g.40506  ORF Transcript_14576/g.40506 Transcript_14576/m.40506 type:complete len:527 (-) Transcript_14576:646-2226(-)|eukprot:CAMPEP_0172371606 /NCGR_PEP_ID=MMETSP1060-20121228/43877_1 /TAXON_ID=37318 /ORGANISM="Pseudo-nitzschia pungens, Strain cf. cingulata" /LENGTH=526 /DNA_ID=CAMNT_0013097291 /DNA_START=110 /DNA_END=1690 /DNA_ORIENTATION=-